MKNLILSVLLLVWSLPGIAANFQVKTLNKSELDALRSRDRWTFEVDETQKTYSTGLIKPGVLDAEAPSQEYFNAKKGEIPQRFELSGKAELSPIYDQGNCGSCVYNAVLTAYMDTMRVASYKTPQLARQELMDCYARDWRCNGSYFTKVAKGLSDAKGLIHEESNYPYRAVNSSCKEVNGTKWGKFQSYRVIDNSQKSGINALLSGKALAVTVGAGGAWMSYKSGVFNACSPVGTNHEVVIVGYDCEGECNFNSEGNMPNNKGLWLVKNSWGTGWGEKGYMWTKMTDRSGRLCNNLTEEIGIIETGIEPEPECKPQPKADAGQDKSLVIGGM